MTDRKGQRFLVTAGALALAAAVLLPSMKIGFLADDFYILGRIHTLAREHPGIGSQLAAGLDYRWSERFHAFRPLTIATLQIDHALWGVDARGFRATNVALWLLAAWLFSGVCAGLLGITSPLGRAGALLAFAFWPAGVELLGWTVIRQDSLVVGAALASVLLLLRFRARPALAALPLAAALASKETAIVLPFMLMAVDAALLMREGRGARELSRALLRRSWSWFAMLALWWVARRAASLEDTWAGGSYAEMLLSAEAPTRFLSHLLDAVRALLVPLNLERDRPAATIVLAAAFGIPAAVALIAAIRRAKTGDVMAGLVWTLAPLAVVLPFYAVSQALESVRQIALSGPVILLSIVALAARWRRVTPRLACAVGVVFLATEALALRFNLDAYVEASRRVEQVREDAGTWPGGTVWLLRSRVGETLVPSLMIHQGAYILSSSIHDALRPPFRAAPIDLRLLSGDDERRLAEIVGQDPKARGAIVTVVPAAEGPRLRLLCEAPLGDVLSLEPPHGSTVPRDSAPVFAITAETAQPGDVCEAVVVEPLGARLVARRVVSSEHVRERRARIEFRQTDFGIPAKQPPLEAVEAPVFVWSATLLRGGSVIARSPWAAVAIIPRR